MLVQIKDADKDPQVPDKVLDKVTDKGPDKVPDEDPDKELDKDPDKEISLVVYHGEHLSRENSQEKGIHITKALQNLHCLVFR